MTDRQALEIAEQLVGSNDPRDTDVRAVARSLEALVPELGKSWAIAEVQAIPRIESEPEPWLLSLVGEPSTLWAAFVCPADDPKYEWPRLTVNRYGALSWGIGTITDVIHRDNGSAEGVLRAWVLRLGDERYVFCTNEMVGTPNPSPVEQFGRALAAADGWQISGVRPDNG